MANPFTVYTGSNTNTLTSALLAPNSGIVIDPSSIALQASGSDAVNFYDGSLSGLGIGSGLLLTTGTTPGTTNTVGWFGQDNSIPDTFFNGDPNIDAVVNTVFQTQSYDATTLSFDFSVADPAATSVSFDLVFGSDEFPEWVDQFVDCAVVMVNGVNYALFNHDPLHPLSVVSSNLAAGYFQDNAVDPVTGLSLLPIEYDGVSHVLKIVAPINAGGGINHIKIGIADTGDHIYDSGIFLSNFSAGTIPGSGVVAATPNTGTDGSDNVTGSIQDEYFDLKAGDDTLYAGGGDDIVIAGSGNDNIYGGSGNDELKGDGGNDNLDGGDGFGDTAVYSGASSDYHIVYNGVGSSFTITDTHSGLTSEGTDTVTNIEYLKFSDGLFALDVNGLTPVSSIGTPPPSNTPGNLAISGIGSAGNTLTATLSDADGISGSVNYQWQISGDNGNSWSDISGAVNNTYLLSNSDTGNLIQVTASYIDNGSQAESPVSAAKTIFAPQAGDLMVTLMHLDAPLGTSVVNPLTTLIKNAMDLGLSPNEAALEIKSVLGIPADVKLQSYDAYSVLQSAPNDPTALAVEKVAVQVAILTSLSDDDTGMNLTISILDAAANNKSLDLANLNDLCFILGVDPLGSLPDSLSVIYDRNKSMSDSLADGGNVNSIEHEWVDFCGIQDNINSTSIADLSIHLNQAPVGSATAALPVALQNELYLISSTDLLQGFTDPDGNSLAVSAISADAGGEVQDNGDGTWSFIPFQDYSGPVELTYTIEDGKGAAITASQIFVVTAATSGNSNYAPTGEVVIVGELIKGQTLSADLSTLADADGLGEISYQWQADGVDIAGANASSFTLTQAEVGMTITVVASYTDGNGTAESVGSSATEPIINGNSAPTGELLIIGESTQGQTLTADITTLADADGLGEISYQWQSGGVDIAGATASSFTLTQAEVQKHITVTASYTDGNGTAELLLSSATNGVTNIDDAATGTLAVSGIAAEGGSLSATLSDVVDLDGSTTTSFQWEEFVGGAWITLTDQNSSTLTIPSDQSYVGKIVRVVASTLDELGGITAFIGESQTIANVNDAPTGTLSITGESTQGQTLTADITTLADADGLGEISYQWQSGGVDIAGATASSFTLTQAEVQKHITVTASYTDGNGTAELLLSSATNGVTNIDDAATGTLAVSGIAAEGGSLSATLSDVVDLDGSTTTSFQWEEFVGGAWITLTGQNSSTLTIPSDQSYVGKIVRVVASTLDELGGITAFIGESQTIANVNDAPTGTLSITGSAQQGQTLNATNMLADADGLGIMSYQWQAGGVTISGAVGSSYTLTQAEVGKLITVTASYTDGYGTFESVTSAATIPVTPLPGLTLTGTAAADTLNGGSANDTLYGLAGNDKLNGFAGNDTLDGGAGIDTMAGGLGDDTYVIDNTADKVIENLGEGTDLVLVNVTTANGTYTVANNVENATLINTVAFNLTGNALANLLTGNDAANILNGGAGADTLVGGGGNDTYLIDSAGDVIIESANAGTDLAQISIATAGGSYTLADNVENASLLNTVSFSLVGNSLANTLTGNALSNTLTGAGGNDALTGGQGIDTFVVDSGTDSITDLGNGGADILKVSAGATANATVTVAWIATSATVNNGTTNITTNGLEVNLGNVVTGNGYNVTNTGTAALLTGSAAADLLNGGTGKDTLNGGNGNDLLNGGNGNDALTGGAGSDIFQFSTALGKNNIDTVADFQHGSDKIELLANIFTTVKGSDGIFNAADILIGAGVTKGSVAGDEHLIFNTTTKALSYDADGGGAGAAVQFATLTGVVTLSEIDFIVH